MHKPGFRLIVPIKNNSFILHLLWITGLNVIRLNVIVFGPVNKKALQKENWGEEFMLQKEEAVLLFIDVQGRLHEIMYDKETLDSNLEKMIQCAQLLEVPIIVTEQLPEKLGSTSEPFKTFLANVPKIEKSSFSCCSEPEFSKVFESLNKQQAILVGIEAHVCVYQTAIDLLGEGFEVFVIADAVASRSADDKTIVFQAMRDAGVKIIPTETALFALLRDAADPRFKELLKLIHT